MRLDDLNTALAEAEAALVAEGEANGFCTASVEMPVGRVLTFRNQSKTWQLFIETNRDTADASLKLLTTTSVETRCQAVSRLPELLERIKSARQERDAAVEVAIDQVADFLRTMRVPE